MPKPEKIRKAETHWPEAAGLAPAKDGAFSFLETYYFQAATTRLATTKSATKGDVV